MTEVPSSETELIVTELTPSKEQKQLEETIPIERHSQKDLSLYS